MEFFFQILRFQLDFYNVKLNTILKYNIEYVKLNSDSEGFTIYVWLLLTNYEKAGFIENIH